MVKQPDGFWTQPATLPRPRGRECGMVELGASGGSGNMAPAARARFPAASAKAAVDSPVIEWGRVRRRVRPATQAKGETQWRKTRGR